MACLDKNDLSFIEKFLNTFKSLGGNELGTINYHEFKTAMILNNGLSEEEVSHLVGDEHCIMGSELDYINLCISILSKKVLFNRITSENKKTRRSSSRINSRTFTRRKPSSQSTDQSDASDKSSDLKFKLVSQGLKGSFFNIDPSGELLGHSYKLEILENSVIEIFVKPLSKSDQLCNTQIEILVFLNNNEKNKPLVAFSSERNTEGCCVVKCNLKKGIYIIVPVILNWNSSTNSLQQELQEPLTEINSNGESILTSSCERALRTVFDCIDIDGNGLINQMEFDLFIQHISGETALDEWSTVEDNFTMENNQLTFDGFLELYKLALETDSDDVISMFQKMGMNDSLHLENALPFLLTINSKTTKLFISPLPISSFSLAVDRALRKIVVEQGFCNKVKNMNDLFLYTQRLPHRVTIVIQNQSHCKITVRLDCSKSENCFSHRKTLDYSAQVPPRTSVVGHHLFPSDYNIPWTVECMESMVK